MRGIYTMDKKLKNLRKNLLHQGFKKEAGLINKLIKIAVTDEQLEGKLEYSKSKKAIKDVATAQNISADENAINYVDNSLTALGFVPGVGIFADAAALTLHAYLQRWISCVLDLIALIPAVGNWIKATLSGAGRISKVVLIRYGDTIIDILKRHFTKSWFYSSLLSFITNLIDNARQGKDIDLNSGSPIATDPRTEQVINSRIGSAVAQTIGNF